MFIGFCQHKLHEITNMYPDMEIIDNKAKIEIEPLTALVFEQEKENIEYARKAGIIMHPTSLPSDYGIGDLGKEAYNFVDWLVKAKQKIWQVLPLNPVGYEHLHINLHLLLLAILCLFLLKNWWKSIYWKLKILF